MIPIPADELTAIRAVEFLRSFSGTRRIRIAYSINMQEMNTSKIAELIGFTQSAVPHHLRGLRQKNIVAPHREGKEVYYSVINPDIVTLFQQGVGLV